MNAPEHTSKQNHLVLTNTNDIRVHLHVEQGSEIRLQVVTGDTFRMHFNARCEHMYLALATSDQILCILKALRRKCQSMCTIIPFWSVLVGHFLWRQAIQPPLSMALQMWPDDTLYNPFQPYIGYEALLLVVLNHWKLSVMLVLTSSLKNNINRIELDRKPVFFIYFLSDERHKPIFKSHELRCPCTLPSDISCMTTLHDHSALSKHCRQL